MYLAKLPMGGRAGTRTYDDGLLSFNVNETVTSERGLQRGRDRVPGAGVWTAWMLGLLQPLLKGVGVQRDAEEIFCDYYLFDITALVTLGSWNFLLTFVVDYYTFIIRF